MCSIVRSNINNEEMRIIKQLRIDEILCDDTRDHGLLDKTIRSCRNMTIIFNDDGYEFDRVDVRLNYLIFNCSNIAILVGTPSKIISIHVLEPHTCVDGVYSLKVVNKIELGGISIEDYKDHPLEFINIYDEFDINECYKL